MRSPDEFRFARLAPKIARAPLTLSLGLALAACGGGAGQADLASAGNTVAPSRVNGPAADYPVTVGAPYFVGDTEYQPADVLNYDHVGYATLDAGAMGYSGAHHTLPLPSYVEVTALDSGRTILIRVERRGPMASNHLVALSPAAMAQLGATSETPVRVRRAVPPEEHRYLLRAGQAAPLRMDTPPSLLNVLRRRLPEDGGASLRAGNTAPPAATPRSAQPIETVEIAPSSATQTPAPRPLPPVNEAPAPVPAPLPAPAPRSAGVPALPPLDAGAPVTQPGGQSADFDSAFNEEAAPEAAPALAPTVTGGFVVQAAAFTDRSRADRVARVIGGQVTQAGRFYRVRTGPFATRGEAEASLANVQRAGYTDARIFTGD